MTDGFELVLSGADVVDQISERWGVRPVPSGKCVWFELPLAATV
jgi:hypothetical protein